MQDVERKGDGASLKEGVSRNRIPSVHDPEMRHGHKSSSVRFDGYKAAVAVDTDSQLITAVEVLPGNAPDNTGAMELVEQREENTACQVEETIGDCAYGDGATRQAFVDAGRTIVAKVPGRPNKAYFPKEDFQVDLKAGTCTCPAGQVTRRISIVTTRTTSGRKYRAQGFHFHGATCGKCQLRSACVAAGKGRGRTITLHPQEILLQQARQFQKSEAFAEYRKRRQVAEHRLARLVQLGIRQARYFGRVKTHFQLLMAATVANLTLVAARVEMMKEAVRPCLSAVYYLAQYLKAFWVSAAKFSSSWLTPANPQGKWVFGQISRQEIGSTGRLDLLIVDEVGFVPFTPEGARLLFQAFTERYLKGILLITSNLEFSRWLEVFGDERMTGALLDRLTHHCHVLEFNGDSYRFKESLREKDKTH